MATGATTKRVWPAVEPGYWERWFTEYGVRLGPSTIPGAGTGVFACVDIAAGRLLSPYRGVVLTQDQYDVQYADANPTYVLAHELSGESVYIDAADARDGNWTRFVNDARGLTHMVNFRNNCAFSASGWIKTTTAVPAGQELFCAYGDGYWGRDED